MAQSRGRPAAFLLRMTSASPATIRVALPISTGSARAFRLANDGMPSIVARKSSLQAVVIAHHAIPVRHRIVRAQDDGIETSGKLLQLTSVHRGLPEHEIEIHRRHRRPLQRGGGVPEPGCGMRDAGSGIRDPGSGGSGCGGRDAGAGMRVLRGGPATEAY